MRNPITPALIGAGVLAFIIGIIVFIYSKYPDSHPTRICMESKLVHRHVPEAEVFMGFNSTDNSYRPIYITVPAHDVTEMECQEWADWKDWKENH